MKRYLIDSVLFVVLICVTQISCRNNTDTDIYNIDVKQNCSLTDFFEDYDIVPLETNDDCLVSEISTIRHADSVMYILDDRSTDLFCFSTKGKYLCKLSKRGRGEGEYTAITDFDIHNDKIYILSRADKKIFIYDKIFTYLKSIELDDWYSNFKIINDKEMLLYSENSNNRFFNYILFDYASSKIVANFDRFDKKLSYGLSGTPFSLCDTKTFICKPFDYTIYEFADNQIKPYLNFDFNTSYSLPKQVSDIEVAVNETKNKNVVQKINSIQVVNDKTYMLYDLFDDEYGICNYITAISILDMKTKTTCLNKQSDALFPIIGRAPVLSDKMMFTYLPAFVVKDMLSRMQNGNMLDLTISNDDNPVIFIYKLRL